MPLTTQTGHEFANAEVALEFIREQQRLLLSKTASVVQSSMATIEIVYTFMALDQHLSTGGTLPIGWARAGRPGERV